MLLEVVSQSWILIVCDSFELSIGIKAKHHAEAIVNKTKYRIGVNELLHWCVALQSIAILNRGEKVHHEVNCKENADEDVDHYYLVANLMLDDVQYEEEEYAEYSLS